MFTIYDYSLNIDNHWVDLELVVTHFEHVEPHKGSPYTCDSSDDYYGYTEITWEVFTYSITDEDETILIEGSDDLPPQFQLNDDHTSKIEQYLIEMMISDINTF